MPNLIILEITEKDISLFIPPVKHNSTYSEIPCKILLTVFIAVKIIT